MSALLWHAFSPAFVSLVLITFAVYTAWTVALTQLSADRRTEANKLDGEASMRSSQSDLGCRIFPADIHDHTGNEGRPL